jgi:hypothetical protein
MRKAFSRSATNFTEVAATLLLPSPTSFTLRGLEFVANRELFCEKGALQHASEAAFMWPMR